MRCSLLFVEMSYSNSRDWPVRTLTSVCLPEVAAQNVRVEIDSAGTLSLGM